MQVPSIFFLEALSGSIDAIFECLSLGYFPLFIFGNVEDGLGCIEMSKVVVAGFQQFVREFTCLSVLILYLSVQCGMLSSLHASLGLQV